MASPARSQKSEVRSQEPEFRCPQCGVDVTVQGYTVEARVMETYMRIAGKLQRIATASMRAEKAYCLTCAAALPSIGAKAT